MKKRQQQTLIFVVILLVMLLVIGIILLLQTEKFSYYHNAQYGFGMNYPQNWKVIENSQGTAVIFMSPKENELDAFQENVNIVVQDLSRKPMGLNEYTSLAITQLIAVFKHNIEMIESKPIYWANMPAHKLVYIGKGNDGSRTKLVHVWAVQGTTAYQLTFATPEAQYDKYSGSVNTMINSFRLK